MIELEDGIYTKINSKEELSEFFRLKIKDQESEYCPNKECQKKRIKNKKINLTYKLINDNEFFKSLKIFCNKNDFVWSQSFEIDLIKSVLDNKITFTCCDNCLRKDMEFVNKKTGIATTQIFSYIRSRFIYFSLMKRFLYFCDMHDVKFDFLESLNLEIEFSKKLDIETMWFRNKKWNSEKSFTYLNFVSSLPLKWIFDFKLKEYIGKTNKQGKFNGPDFIFFDKTNDNTIGFEVFGIPMVDVIIANKPIIKIEKYSNNIETEYMRIAKNLNNLYNFSKTKILEKSGNYKNNKYIKTSKFSIGFLINNDILDHWAFLLELLFVDNEFPVYIL